MSFPDDPSGVTTPPGQPAFPSSPPSPSHGEEAPPSPVSAQSPAAEPPAPPAARPVSDFDHPVGDLTDWEHGPGPLPGDTTYPADSVESPAAVTEAPAPAQSVPPPSESELAAGDAPAHPVSDFDHPVGDLTDWEHGPGPLPGSEFEHPTGPDPWWTSQGSAPVETPAAVEAPPTSVFVPTSTDHEPLPVHKPAAPVATGGAPPKPPRPPEPPGDSDDEEEGMAQMSFLEHLEELRKRILLGVGGVGVAFFVCLIFSDELWAVVFAPAGAALRHLGVVPPELVQISPMDAFQIMWMKLPILAAVFLSSPWILYQVWAFIAPGLYRKERRYAAPFVLSSAGLFILGGMFAYFVAFRYGLEFLIGLGIGKGVHPTISMNEYYDLFVDVMLGVGIVFEIPILLFLLTLIRVASPRFLVAHSRYAILIIVILAAVITPTGDVFNLALFATPMIILFYVGIFASYILVLKRENRRFPWGMFFKVLGIVIVATIAIVWLAAKYYGYHIELRWPFLFK